MTHIVIQKQIEDIRKATQNASQSKETATRFLTEAGIMNTQTHTSIPSTVKVFSKKKK